jgi:hypothetical protein
MISRDITNLPEPRAKQFERSSDDFKIIRNITGDDERIPLKGVSRKPMDERPIISEIRMKI